jgi:protein-S-isoprenylcysteine O-methyltransferase Ste14
LSALVSPFLIILAVALYGVVHSWLASLRLKAMLRQRFGNQMTRMYRLAYNVFATLSFLPILALSLALPDKEFYRIPYPWLLLTATIQGLAVLLLLVGLWQTGLWAFLGLQQLLEPPQEVTQKFVVNGLYRWVRHPLYTAGLLFIWLTPIMTINELALIVGLTAYLVVGAYVEERKLVAEFGEAYLRYRDRTPMLFPIRISKPAGRK